MSKTDFQNGFVMGFSVNGKPKAKLCDYTVTFKIGNVVYEIVSVNAGTSITAPTVPTVPTGTGVFSEWQLSGENVIFPYTPTENVEMTALFVEARTEMDLSQSDVIWSGQYSSFTKTNQGWAIGGYVTATNNNYRRVFLVSDTRDGCAFTTSNSVTEFDYDGSTYYIGTSGQMLSTTGFSSKLKDMTSYTESQYINAATSLLNYYYYVTN